MFGLPFGGAPFGGTSAPVTAGAPSSITGVTIAPSLAIVASGGTQHFTKTVTGTGSFSTAGTWSISAGGTIDASGNASGPTGAYVVTFTSDQDPDYSDAASFTVLAPGAATPAPVFAVSTIMRRATVRMSATLTAPTYLTANLL